VALDGPVKMTEITYTHAEGFAAGELKHGTLALVTEVTPVFAMVSGDGEAAREIVGNVLLQLRTTSLINWGGRSTSRGTWRRV
jgi:glucosamine 6-phosphate synthetase-like amidotransferase/phosphosugar isomerase protein